MCNKGECRLYSHEAIKYWQVANNFRFNAQKDIFEEQFCKTCRNVNSSPMINDPRVEEHVEDIMYALELKNNKLKKISMDIQNSSIENFHKNAATSLRKLTAGIGQIIEDLTDEIRKPDWGIFHNHGMVSDYLKELEEFILILNKVTNKLNNNNTLTIKNEGSLSQTGEA